MDIGLWGLMSLLQKLQNLPEAEKKLIAWGVTIVAGILLLSWGVPRASQRIQQFQGLGPQGEVPFPEVNLEEFIPQEQIEAFQEQVKELEETATSQEDGQQ